MTTHYVFKLEKKYVQKCINLYENIKKIVYKILYFIVYVKFLKKPDRTLMWTICEYKNLIFSLKKEK